MKITYESIGTIHSPFKEREGMPIQSKGATGVKGQVAVNEELLAGLQDLNGFSHIFLIYHFHKSTGFDLLVMPFLDKTKRGIFATRAPRRPNAIRVSVVKLLSIEKNILNIENVDILDGTPLLDIKPYVSKFDSNKTDKDGWVGNRRFKLNEIKSDNRFE
jgi:tRNA-Thr(GGU) m(6)t(6)A37 methyltransferase TsaA